MKYKWDHLTEYGEALYFTYCTLDDHTSVIQCGSVKKNEKKEKII